MSKNAKSINRGTGSNSDRDKRITTLVKNVLLESLSTLTPQTLPLTARTSNNLSECYTGAAEGVLQSHKKSMAPTALNEGLLQAAAELQAQGDYIKQRIPSYTSGISQSENERISDIFQQILDACMPSFISMNFSNKEEMADYLSKCFIGAGEVILQSTDKERDIPDELKEDAIQIAQKFQELGESLSKKAV